jgi:hypothetical protein
MRCWVRNVVGPGPGKGWIACPFILPVAAGALRTRTAGRSLVWSGSGLSEEPV